MYYYNNTNCESIFLYLITFHIASSLPILLDVYMYVLFIVYINTL